MSEAPMLVARDIRKSFGAIEALSGVSLTVRSGQVTCLLGDNGAGKSTLIKIISGVLAPDSGEIRLDGEAVAFRSARDALDRGIATVYQDLAVVPVLPIYRNFFLGREPEIGRGAFRRFDKQTAIRVASEEIAQIGIEVGDVHRPIQTLSGGERQSVAIARAIHFGARILILDEPTSALGVKEAGIVLRYVRRAKERGVGIVFITHNVHHAYSIADTFEILKRGAVSETFSRESLTKEALLTHMAGGEELNLLTSEIDA
jgi:simple sugar transport system ATP-binding protein